MYLGIENFKSSPDDVPVQPGLGVRAPEQWFLQFKTYKNHLEGLLKYRPLGTTPRVSNAIDLGTGLRNCIAGLP